MSIEKRVTRKQLLKEPDEFLSFSSRILLFFTRNSRQVFYALGGVLIAGLVIYVVGYYSAKKENNAFELLEQGIPKPEDEFPEGKTKPVDVHAKDNLVKVIKQYPSTKASRLSMLLLGRIKQDEGAYDEAIDLYNKAQREFSGNEAIVKIIWSDLGGAHEAKKDYQTAAQFFERITQSQGELLKPDAYLALGRIYEAMNAKDKAADAYGQLAKQYPMSPHNQIAKSKEAMLRQGKGAVTEQVKAMPAESKSVDTQLAAGGTPVKGAAGATAVATRP